MIVFDLYSADCDEKARPAERIEVWNIEASNILDRGPLPSLCNYGVRTMLNPESRVRKIFDDLFGGHSMRPVVTDHYNLQTSWSLLARILDLPEIIRELNHDWSKNPGLVNSKNFEIVMEIWPHGDRSEASKITTLQVRSEVNETNYTFLESSEPPFLLQGPRNENGQVQGTLGEEKPQDTPWSIAQQITERLIEENHFISYVSPAAKPTPSPMLQIGELSGSNRATWGMGPQRLTK